MFAPARGRILKTGKWEPRSDVPLEYVEAWKYPGNDAVAFRTGQLQDAEVDAWLHQEDKFGRIGDAQLRKPEGGIRLLICERLGKFEPLGFFMSQRTFLNVEKTFRLPCDSLAALNNSGGVYSSNYLRSDGKDGHEFVAMTLKVPQMAKLGNAGLVLSHCFQTGITLAFLHGQHVLDDRNRVPGVDKPRHATAIMETVQHMRSMLAHPLLLPVALLHDHLFRGKDLLEDGIAIRAIQAEHDLGVTRTSSRGTKENHTYPEALTDAEQRIDLTGRLNTTFTEAINLLGTLKWDSRCCAFLVKVCDEIGGSFPSSHVYLSENLKGTLETLQCIISGTEDYAETIRARMEVQLNVLYNFVAQVDSSINMETAAINAKVAAAAGLDSAAMKTLALVTTIFLPPTFIATLFSMSMFDWQAGSSDSTGASNRLADDFWIYWATSIPLTIVVLFGWRLWWRFQKYYFLLKYPDARTRDDLTTGRAFLRFLKDRGQIRDSFAGDSWTEKAEKQLDPMV